MKRWLRRLRARLRRKPSGRPREEATDLALAVPFAEAARVTDHPRLLVHIHIFHTDLVAEMRACAVHIGAPCDLLLTTDSEVKLEAILREFEGWPHGTATGKVLPNRGRDIAPKLHVLDTLPDNYELVLFLHTKKSESAAFGDQWRKHLLQALSGSPEIVRSILGLFAADPQLGMVLPQTFKPVRIRMGWGAEASLAQKLASRLGWQLDLNGTLDFPAGSMFWARPSALAPLCELALRADDFPVESGQFSGTPAHAIERLFLLLCEQAGFGWCKVDADAHSGTAIPVAAPGDIEAARVRAYFSVSEVMLR